MPPAHQQQKRLLLLLKRGGWPYYVAIILIACAFWLWHLWFDWTADRLIGFWKSGHRNGVSRCLLLGE
jgi:hypothetical protein